MELKDRGKAAVKKDKEINISANASEILLSVVPDSSSEKKYRLPRSVAIDHHTCVEGLIPGPIFRLKFV